MSILNKKENKVNNWDGKIIVRINVTCCFVMSNKFT